MKCRGRPLEARRSRPQGARDSGEPESSSRTTLPDTHRPAPGPRARNANERLCCAPRPRAPARVPGRTTAAHLRGDLEGPPPTYPSPARGYPAERGGREGAARRASVWEPRAGAGVGGVPWRPPGAETLPRAINSDLLPTRPHLVCQEAIIFLSSKVCRHFASVFPPNVLVKHRLGDKRKPRGGGDGALPTPIVDCSAEGASFCREVAGPPGRVGACARTRACLRSCSSPATASGVAGPGKRPRGAGRPGWFPGRTGAPGWRPPDVGSRNYWLCDRPPGLIPQTG